MKKLVLIIMTSFAFLSVKSQDATVKNEGDLVPYVDMLNKKEWHSNPKLGIHIKGISTYQVLQWVGISNGKTTSVGTIDINIVQRNPPVGVDSPMYKLRVPLNQPISIRLPLGYDVYIPLNSSYQFIYLSGMRYEIKPSN